LSDQPYPPSEATEFQIWKQDIERRMKNLETGAGMVNTSVRGGTTVWRSKDDSKDIALFGLFTDSAGLFEGFVQYDGNGESMFMTRSDKRGIIHPIRPVAFQVFGAVNIVSGSFVPTHIAGMGHMLYEGLFVMLQASSDAATTSEIRLREVTTNSFTDPVTITAGTAGTVRFHWLLSGVANVKTNVRFEIQARVASGAGQVHVTALDAWQTSTALDTLLATNGAPTYS